MSDLVLSTAEAKIAISRIKAILDGGLLEQLNALAHDGQTLSDPNVWDGRLAMRFRNSWPATLDSIKRLTEHLEELRIEAREANDRMMASDRM